ncbi:MAG: glutathione S-transferase family protein [Deltaproteobacteria bacterium]|nr:MAG: glutathione S-transferase family protein [Deltaproteobacteria bacterium]
MTAVLVELPYSPWSRRARQALILEGVPHRRESYTIALSEPMLRIRTRRLRGPITIPCLIPPDGPPLFDSTQIASWASARGKAKLLPEELGPEILEIVRLADRCLEAGRLRSTAILLKDPALLAEQVPPALKPLGPLGPRIARRVGQQILRRYDHLVDGDPAQALKTALAELGARVGEGGPLVGGRLTYADLAAASGLGFVAPPDDGTLGPGTRRAFSWPELAEEHEHLVRWRDRLHIRLLEQRPEHHHQEQSAGEEPRREQQEHPEGDPAER